MKIAMKRIKMAWVHNLGNYLHSFEGFFYNFRLYTAFFY